MITEQAVNCAHQAWGICFTLPDRTAESAVFRFSDFIAALALLVIVYTVADVRYRFRIAIAPTSASMFALTYTLIGIIGFGTLLTDVWVAARWPFPESLITQNILRGGLAFMFLGLAMTWIWYAFIRPPVFGRRNYRRYARVLYAVIVKGSNDELPVVADELGRSAEALVRIAKEDKPLWMSAVQPTTSPSSGAKKKKTPGSAAEWAHDILLLIGNRKFCRMIVGYCPITAIEIFESASKHRKLGLPLGQFARNISTEAILNKDSSLYHEDSYFDAGLLGQLKPFSKAIYGDFELVEALGGKFGSPLDIPFDVLSMFDAEHWETYCRVMLLTFTDYLKRGNWGRHSYALFRSFSDLEHGTKNLAKIEKLDYEGGAKEILGRLNAIVKLHVAAIDLCNKVTPVPGTVLRTRERNANETLYDTIVDGMTEVIYDASGVGGPPDTGWCWPVQHNAVWSEYFRPREEGVAWKIVMFKLRRNLYDEIKQLDKYMSFKAARILGLCLNVMGLTVQKGTGIDAGYRALHKVVVAYAKRNYLRIRASSLRVADACLLGGITFDEEGGRLIKTYVRGTEQEGSKDYLVLDLT